MGRGRTAIHLLLAVACFALACTLVERRYGWELSNCVLRLGERCGQSVSYISKVVIGPNGPFNGDGAVTGAWNFAWRHVDWVAPALAGYVAAAAVFAGLERMGRPRLPRDGRTRCGACGYVLSGLREPRCPECGRAL